MLSRADYTDWAEMLRKQQGIKFGEEWETLLSWYSSLKFYDLGELHHAAVEIGMSTQPAPARMVDYRGWIHRLVHEYRAVEAKTETARRADTYGECATCSGCGLAEVPHPRCIVGGEWVPLKVAGGILPQYFTLAVFCTCGLGQFRCQTFENRKGQKSHPISLAEYDRMNPHWKAQMAKRAAERLAEARQCVDEARGLEGERMRLTIEIIRKVIGNARLAKGDVPSE